MNYNHPKPKTFGRFIYWQREKKNVTVSWAVKNGYYSVRANHPNQTVIEYPGNVYIELLAGGLYYLNLESEEFKSFDLLELELRLWDFSVALSNGIEARKERKFRIEWLIRLSNMVFQAERLVNWWYDSGDYEGDLEGIFSLAFPFDKSFDDVVHELREYLNYQVGLLRS